MHALGAMDQSVINSHKSKINVGVNQSVVSVACSAVSKGHFGKVMVKKVEKEIVVLSKFEFFKIF